MSKINWEDYKEEILNLYQETGSSAQVALELANKYGSQFLLKDRQVRMCLNRWGDDFRKSPVPSTQAKVLVFDIETAPMITYSWSKWPDSIPDNFIIRDWYILTWSAKWLFSDEVIEEKCTPTEAKAGDDERIVKKLWKVLDEADIVIAHNLLKFDEKRANTRFLKYGLNPPSSYQKIDTLMHARKKLSVTSNRLDYLAQQFFEIEGKIDTAKGLWREATEGSAQALKDMAEYCSQDVKVLESVYLCMRSWITPHPNMNLFTDGSNTVCPACGSEDLKKLKGRFYRTYANVYQEHRCNSCGATSHGAKASTPDAVKITKSRQSN